MLNEFEALRFVRLDFGGAWIRRLMPDGVVEYQAQDRGGTLNILAEASTGLLQTQHHKLRSGETVQVIGQVVHVPGTEVAREYEETLVQDRHRAARTA